MHCPDCGRELMNGSHFCDACGRPMEGLDICPPEVLDAPDEMRQYPPERPETPPAPTPTTVPPQEVSPYNPFAYYPPPPTYTAMPTAASPAPDSGRILGALLLMAIPVVGLVLMLVWSFAGGVTPDRRHLARACLVFALIVLAVLLLCAVFFILFFWESIVRGDIFRIGGLYFHF